MNMESITSAMGDIAYRDSSAAASDVADDGTKVLIYVGNLTGQPLE
jgi:hypothetical protein